MAHEAELVLGLIPRRALKSSSVTRLMLWPHWNTATYCARYHLLTPRNSRRKFRRPVHSPSCVLQWTSRTPSPSRSNAQVPLGPEWSTVTWVRRRCFPTRLYPFHSSVLTVTSSKQASSRTSSSSAPLADAITSRRTSPDSRPTTPATGGRSLAKVPCPRRRLARRRGGSAGSGCSTPFFPRVDVRLVGIDHGVAQRIPVQPVQGMALAPMAQLQPVLAVAPQLSRQWGRGLSMGEA